MRSISADEMSSFGVCFVCVGVRVESFAESSHENEFNRLFMRSFQNGVIISAAIYRDENFALKSFIGQMISPISYFIFVVESK